MAVFPGLHVVSSHSVILGGAFLVGSPSPSCEIKLRPSPQVPYLLSLASPLTIALPPVS